jgi:hypothetical protein
MGLLATDAVRAPLLTLDEPARGRLEALLRECGLVEAAGGRIAVREQGAVA